MRREPVRHDALVEPRQDVLYIRVIETRNEKALEALKKEVRRAFEDAMREFEGMQRGERDRR